MTGRLKRQTKHGGFKHTGSVLALTVLLVLISLIIGTGMLMLGTQARVDVIDKTQNMMARSAADAGVEYAIQQINNAVKNGTWSTSVLPAASDMSLYGTHSTYTVSTQYDPINGYAIDSLGTNQRRSRQITAQLRLKGLFELGIQCRDNIILKSGTVIEAIDSDLSLSPGDTDEKAVIGTCSVEPGSIVLNYGVDIDGDVLVGIGGDVDTVIKDLGASIDDRYPLTYEIEFPPVDPPALFGPGMPITVTAGEKTIGAGGDFPAMGRFSDLKLKNGCKLRVIDDCVLYITGNVDMGQSSEIIVDSSKDASLTIYLDGDWLADNDASVTNQTQNTTAFQMYGTGGPGQEIDLKAKGDLFGSIYAPDAILTVYSEGDIYGAFVADSFELKNSANFYYDIALQDVSVTDEGARYVVSRWTEN